jgi:murein DD-endopeptidase MepM/ murein hydrolase activator NlpD
MLCAAALVAVVPAERAHAGSGEVAALQVAMRALGLYPHTVDGISGPWTVEAVRSFQSRRGLTADGVAGAETRRALGRRGGPDLGSRPMRPGQRGWDVAALQYLLDVRGFGQGGLDGGFGANTEGAVREFQRSAGLAVDGVAGPAVLEALRRSQNYAVSDPVRFLAPVPGPSTDGFGFVHGRRHNGIDYPGATGDSVTAAGRGVVSFAGWNHLGYGNLVVIRHRLGYETWYAHLSAVDASPGQPVVGGTHIGHVGSTGYSTGPHLHFEARRFGTPLDPAPRLLAAAASASATAAPVAEHSSKRAKSKGRRRCRPNADVLGGRHLEPARARIDRCP